MVSWEFERFEALELLALELGGAAQDHVGAVADLHALRTAGVDRQARRGEERGRRCDRQGDDRSPGAHRECRARRGRGRVILGDQSFEHQLVG